MHIGVVYDILLLCSQPGCFSKQVQTFACFVCISVKSRGLTLVQHIIDAFNSSLIDAIVNLFQVCLNSRFPTPDPGCIQPK
jgi:hypothetical protein